MKKTQLDYLATSRIATFAMSVVVLAMSSSIGAQTPAAQGDAAAGKKKNAMCQGCHGIAGWRTAFPEVYHVPKIAGQHPQYIVSALKAYKSGERTNETMKSIAAQLSDKDMEDLAAYYGTARDGK
jgi:cytochrome c553